MINSNIYLIHGCKTRNDCLYLNELKYFKQKEILNHLKICYSRENALTADNFKYVQDYLRTLSEIKKLILDENTHIYCCGDQIKFTKDVFNTLIQCIDQSEAEQLLKDKKKNKSYLEDVWL